MTALVVKQNSALSEAKQRFPYGLHSKRMGSHFASKAEPSSLRAKIFAAGEISVRSAPRTTPPNEVKQALLKGEPLGKIMPGKREDNILPYKRILGQPLNP